MKITVCDDQERELEIILKLCQKYVLLKNFEAEVNGITDSLQLKDDIPDVLVLDIEMPGKSGIEVKDSLLGRERPLILFATSHEEMMPEAFGTNVIGFLRKPVQWQQFEKMMDCAASLLSLDRLLQFDDGSTVNSQNVLLIKSDNKYTEVVLVDGEKKQWLRKSLKTWEDELSEIGFISISRSCLVNCRHIKSFEGSKVILKDGQKLSISGKRKTECFNKFKDYNLKHARFA